jgi:hypothetical protein
VLYAWRKDRDLREDTLICWTSHDLVGVLLAPGIRANEDDTWSQVLDKMPTLTRDREQVNIVRHRSQNFECGVVLEEKVHLNTNPPDILDHMALLHVLGVAAEAIENVVIVQTANLRDLCKSLSDSWLIEM